MRIDKQKLGMILAKKQLTQKGLAEKMRMSQTRLCGIMKADRLQPKTIGRIANALNVRVEDIITKEERK